MIKDVSAPGYAESQAALWAAARLAHQGKKDLILFEHPAAPSYGSRYPGYSQLETPCTQAARAAGAQVITQGADPDSSPVPDADWIKLLDTGAFMQAALPLLAARRDPWPDKSVRFETEAGPVTVGGDGAVGRVLAAAHPETETVQWPSGAVAQLVTGYQKAAAIDARYQSGLSPEALGTLHALFTPHWRFSRHEGWVFRS